VEKKKGGVPVALAVPPKTEPLVGKEGTSKGREGVVEGGDKSPDRMESRFAGTEYGSKRA